MVEHRTLAQRRVAYEQAMFPGGGVYEEFYDIEYDRMLMRMKQYFCANTVHTQYGMPISYPADWWQAFKERWFPTWLRTRFPPKMQRIQPVTEHLHACPHLAMPDFDHISWLMYDEDAE